jgi:hypothetical protein
VDPLAAQGRDPDVLAGGYLMGANRIDVVARTTDRDLVHPVYTTTGGWSRWRNLGGTWSAQPAIASPVARRLEVFLRGAIGALEGQAFSLGLGWTGATLLGDNVFTSGPGVTATGDDVVVGALRANGPRHLRTRTSPTRAWFIWRIVDMYLRFRKLATGSTSMTTPRSARRSRWPT